MPPYTTAPRRPTVPGQTDQETEEQKRKRLQRQGGAPGQQAPWSTPSSTASTSGGPSRNPFAGSIYSRPAQTMAGPTVATFSAQPQGGPQEELPLWQQIRRTIGSMPGAPGGGPGGGMFMPTVPQGGGGGGVGPRTPISQFMPTIPLGKIQDLLPGGQLPSSIPLPGGGSIPLPNLPKPPGLGGGPRPGPGAPAGEGGGGQPPPMQIPQLPKPPGGGNNILDAIVGAITGGGGGNKPPAPSMPGGGGNTGITGGMDRTPAPAPPPTPPIASLLPPPGPPPQQVQAPPPVQMPSFKLPNGGTDWQAQLNWINANSGQAAPGGGTYNGTPAPAPAPPPPQQAAPVKKMPPGMGPGVPGYTWYLANGYTP